MAFVGLGVSGGVGAYKAVEVVRLLQKRGHRVQVVMTRTARRFVGPLTFEAITRERVITSQFAPGVNAEIEHIALASEMDLLLVVPATANILGKFAHGIADDFLSALHLATLGPVLVAPAMNVNMWNHAAVQANITTLRARGVHVVEPGDGYLACGWIGKGRLAEPEAIAEAADALLGRRAMADRDVSAPRPSSTSAATMSALAGRRVIVTAGPTLEDLDPVRFLGNRSSGRMGFALARHAQARGAEVTLIAGPTSIAPPAVTLLVRVRSAREMHAEVLARAGSADAIVMAAAVADYTPVGGSAPHKVEKTGALTLQLERTPDILAELGERRGDAPRPVLVGFAAQTKDLARSARRKLEAKRVDLIVANDVSLPDAGFDVETNRVTLVSAAGDEELPLLSKDAAAGVILDRLEHLLARLAPPAEALTT